MKELAIAACVLALIFGVASGCDGSLKRMDIEHAKNFALTQGKTYSNWCALYGVTNLTLEQWADLRANDLLPGQVKQNSDGTASGVAVGIAVGSAMNAGRGK